MKREYAIQVEAPEFPLLCGGWMTISGVYDFWFPHFSTEEKAREALKRIETEYAPRTGKKYRIISREVTEWEVV